MKTQCPGCQAVFNTKSENAGKITKCSKCGASFAIADQSTASPKRPPSSGVNRNAPTTFIPKTPGICVVGIFIAFISYIAGVALTISGFSEFYEYGADKFAGSLRIGFGISVVLSGVAMHLLAEGVRYVARLFQLQAHERGLGTD